MLRSLVRLRAVLRVLPACVRPYHVNVIDHYENPRNVGTLDKKSVSVGTALVGAPACGDVMRLQIKVGEDGRIEDAKFKTFGCGSAIASSSVATEWVKGRTVEECLSIKNTDIAAHLKLPPVKLHCSMLAVSFFSWCCCVWTYPMPPPFLVPYATFAAPPRSPLTHNYPHPVIFFTLQEDAIKAAIKDYQSKKSPAQ